MNIKSYMRGIGAGMIVTALIMGVAAPKTDKATATSVEKETLKETVASVSLTSNEDIKENVTIEKENTEDSEIKEIPVVPDVSSDEESQTEDNTEQVVIKEESTKEEVTPPSIDPMPEGDEGFTESGETVEIRVISGDSSVSVSRRLYEAGLVDSAVEFDEYLCDNGYDKYICVGTYDIAKGADFETIAKILSRRN